MRPLLIDEKQKTNITSVVKYAEEHPIPRVIMMERMMLSKQGKNYECPGDDAKMRVEIPFGFRCVFTVEEQPQGWSRHLSVSVETRGNLPSIPAVRMLMKEFGFQKPLEECVVYIEQDAAVNVI